MKMRNAIGFMALGMLFSCANVAQASEHDAAQSTKNNSAPAKAVVACDILSAKEAAQLAGAPLFEALKTEQAPTPGKGNDHQSNCGYFPKGFIFGKTQTPPEIGVMLQVHSMKSAADAKKVYKKSLAMNEAMKNGAHSPFSGNTISKLDGLGDEAFVVESKFEKAHYITNLFLAKGSVMLQIQAWKNDTAPTDIANNAARMLLTKIP